MQIKNSALIAAGFTAQSVLASGWNDASPFSCPGNTNNHCSPSQQGGYNWSGLNNGQFSSYGSNQFSGFSCASSFGKRDLLTKRGFQSKCITGNLDDNPSMSGGSFSIDQIQISSSDNADVECHYGMPDGSTCTETHSCSPGGSTFQNTQCGGAKSVTFKPGKNAPPGCSIGVHSVGFHCGSASTLPATQSTPATAQSVPPSSPPTYHTSSAPTSSPPPPPPSTTTPASSAPTPPCYGSQCSSAPSSPATSSTPSSVSAPCYGKHCGGSPTSVSAASSSPPPPSSPPVSPPPTSSPPSSPPPTKPHHPQCPDVLPRCLKTWMWLTECEGNSDSKCFCPNAKLIKQVMECLSAWSPSPADTQAAASYLMGLCADHVPQNPGIITNCPPGVTPTPPPPPPASVSAQGTPPCTTITWSTTTVTVPKVSLTTSTVTVAGKTSCSVGLGGWTPSSAAASTTPTPPPPPASSPPAYSSPASSPPAYSSPVSSPPPPPPSSPPATSTSVVCSEFTDGQPQCYTSSAQSSPVAAASTTLGTSWGTGSGWGPTASASSSPIVPATGAGIKLSTCMGNLALAALAVFAAL